MTQDCDKLTEGQVSLYSLILDLLSGWALRLLGGIVSFPKVFDVLTLTPVNLTLFGHVMLTGDQVNMSS